MAGSSARLRNMTTLLRTPLASKDCRKMLATSCCTPMAANTMAKRSSAPQEPGLAHDLGRQLVVGQPAHGEDGELLAPHQGVHAVDGGNARLDELLGIGAGRGVDGLAVDVPLVFPHRHRAPIQGPAHAVEDASQKIGGDRDGQGATGEAHPGLL